MVLFCILGILCILYYVVLQIYTVTLSKFGRIWFLMGIIFNCFSIFLYYNKSIGFTNKIPEDTLFSIKSILVALVIVFFMIFINIFIGMFKKPEKKSRYLIVLGASLIGDRVSKSLKYRLQKALKYAKENKDSVIIVSGGKGDNELITEASAMFKYLVDHGIEQSRIIKEEKSKSTKENLLFSKEIIGIESIEKEKIVICSNNFHIFRAMKICKKLGYKNISPLPAKCDPVLLINYLLRETLAVMKEVAIGNIMIFK